MNTTAIALIGIKAVAGAEAGSAGAARQKKEPVNGSVPAARETASSPKRDIPEEKAAPIEPVTSNLLKAFFALDGEDNVVIRFADKEGNIVKQLPPEEFLRLQKQLEETVDSLFSVKA